MPNAIATILKQARKTARLSVKDTAARLNKNGIHLSAKTIYGYESGLSMPNADVFVALCQIYQYDSYSFADTANPALSTQERSLLEDYQNLDACGQNIVRTIVAHEKERVNKLRELENTPSPIKKD